MGRCFRFARFSAETALRVRTLWVFRFGERESRTQLLGRRLAPFFMGQEG